MREAEAKTNRQRQREMKKIKNRKNQTCRQGNRQIGYIEKQRET